MPENLRAAIVVLLLSAPVFWLAGRQVCPSALDGQAFVRRRNTWWGLTALAFAVPATGPLVLLTAALVATVAMRESHRFALYLFLLFAVPPFSASMPDLAPLASLKALDHARLLSLVLLLPCYLTLRRDPEVAPLGKNLVDRCVLGFLLLSWVQLRQDTLAHGLWQGVCLFLDIFLPYWVASRALRTLPAFRDAAMSGVIAVMVMVPVAWFEQIRGSWLYGNMTPAMDPRGDGFRAMASAGQALTLGHATVLASGLYVYARQFIRSPWFVRLGLALLLAGWWLPASRSLCLGGLVLLGVVCMTGHRPLWRILKLLLMGMLLIGALAAIMRVAHMIPDLEGPMDAESHFSHSSTPYPKRLLDVSLQVIQLNPLFGSPTYREFPIMQPLRDGSGRFGLNTTYMEVTLLHGLVGLAFYLAMFMAALRTLWRAWKRTQPGQELHGLGRALLATLLGVVFALFAVGFTPLVATLNALVLGLCLGYKELVVRSQKALPRQT